MPCFALAEECGFVFFELACGLADSWHVVTALCGVRHVLGTSPAKFPRPAPAIYGLPV